MLYSNCLFYAAMQGGPEKTGEFSRAQFLAHLSVPKLPDTFFAVAESAEDGKPTVGWRRSVLDNQCMSRCITN